MSSGTGGRRKNPAARARDRPAGVGPADRRPGARERPDVSLGLRRLKRRTGWSWEKLCLEFQRIMGRSGPSFSTVYRYATSRPKRRNSLLDAFVREALERIETEREESRAGGSPGPGTAEEGGTEGGHDQFLGRARDVIFRYRIRPEQGFEYISPAVLEVTGYSADDFLADPGLLFRLIPRRDLVRLQVRLLGNHRVLEPVLVRCLGREGALTRAEVLSLPLFDEEGELAAVEGVARDVTRRWQSERRLWILSAAVEDASQAIITTDRKGRVTSWNRAAERLFGYAAQEVMGKTANVLDPTGSADAFHGALPGLLAGGPVTYPEVERPCKTGRSIRVSIRVFPLRDARGGVIGLAGFVRPTGGTGIPEPDRS